MLQMQETACKGPTHQLTSPNHGVEAQYAITYAELDPRLVGSLPRLVFTDLARDPVTNSGPLFFSSSLQALQRALVPGD